MQSKYLPHCFLFFTPYLFSFWTLIVRKWKNNVKSVSFLIVRFTFLISALEKLKLKKK